jgi:nodulation protein E
VFRSFRQVFAQAVRGQPIDPRTERQQIGQAAHLGNFNPTDHIAPDLAAATDRFVHFALAAADEAMNQAGWPIGEPMGDRTAVIIGSGIGGSTTSDIGHYKFYVTHERTDPMTVPKVMPSAAASHIAMRYGARGPSFAVSSACSSSTQAIGLGLMLIRSGVVDRAIVGGSEAMLTPATFRAWETLRVMTPSLCRPFSKGRDGMVLGEGAAIFMLENEISASVAPHRLPCFQAMARRVTPPISSARSPWCGPVHATALADANLSPSDIDYINAHGTGTILNDVSEFWSPAAWVFDGSLPDILCPRQSQFMGMRLGRREPLNWSHHMCIAR